VRLLPVAAVTLLLLLLLLLLLACSQCHHGWQATSACCLAPAPAHET
jgi:hypothetical protein